MKSGHAFQSKEKRRQTAGAKNEFRKNALYLSKELCYNQIVTANQPSKGVIKMNKTELIKKVAAENELTQKQAAAVVNSVLDSIMDSLAAHEPVALLGFGTFSCKHRDARQGRNPANGETIDIAASNTPVFKAAKVFKDKVN
jgi:DNA-binding protein HU-beta